MFIIHGVEHCAPVPCFSSKTSDKKVDVHLLLSKLIFAVCVMRALDQASQANFKSLQAPLRTEYLLCSLSARPPDQWHDSERQPRGQPRVFLQITSIEVFPNSVEFASGLAKNSTHATYLETSIWARPSSLHICHSLTSVRCPLELELKGLSARVFSAALSSLAFWIVGGPNWVDVGGCLPDSE